MVGTGGSTAGVGFGAGEVCAGFSSAGNGVMGVLGAALAAGGLVGVGLLEVESVRGCGLSVSLLSGANQSSGSISQSSLDVVGADALVASLGRLAMRRGTG